MSPAVQIATEPGRGLLRLVFQGLLTDQALDLFERELDAQRRAMEARGLSPFWPRVLIDARCSGVQTRTAADRLRARMVRFHAPGRRIAFVVPDGGVLRMQLGRLAANERFAFFADPEGALAWLLAEAAAAA